VTSELSYALNVSGTKAAEITAVVIRRVDAGGVLAAPQRRVIQRVLGPEMQSASGALRLAGDDLDAFKTGRLTLAVFGSAGADPIAEVRLGMP
jgi:hypothetical protein